MKVFVIVTERDGEITKKPGETSTQIIKTERRFAAKTITEVWNKYWDHPSFRDETEELIAIYEEQASITIL
jgi:hypothetical protein